MNEKALVLGASGATGTHLVNQLTIMGHDVKVIVRNSTRVPDIWKMNNCLEIIEASVLDLSADEMANILDDCTSVACCLGHNLSLKGIYGQPRKLVSDSMRLICRAIELRAHENPMKLVLMNTAGNRNRDLMEPISFMEKLVVGLIRVLLPPHPDNEQAADYLRTEIGQNHEQVHWVVVRPDGLTNEDKVTEYSQHKSPTRSAIFNAGKTSRINVGHFMARLLSDNALWQKWQGQMPVIYNKQES